MGKRKFNAKKKQHVGYEKGTVPPAAISIKQPSTSPAYLPLLACILLGIYYWITYTITDGLYQHDEAGHLIDMLSFWDHPLDTLVGLWSRGGYKVLYCIPALGGMTAIVFTNILFSCGAAWFTFQVARQYELKQPWLVIFLFGLQPFIINLSFRCYAEVPTMFFSVLLLFLYQQKKYIATAIVVSFLFTLRQEMAVFAFLLGFFFLFKKKWLPFILLIWAPLALSILGWLKTGNALYIVDSVLQGGVTDTYQRNGFFYLWLMLPEITGVVILVLFLTGYLSLFTGGKEIRRQQWKKFHALLLFFTVYFLMHCAFTSKSFGFGRSGGLGRFLIVVSPFIAIIAQVGFHWLSNAAVKARQRLLLFSLSFLLLLIFLLSVKKIMPLVFNGFTVVVLTSENLLFLFLAVALTWLVLLFNSRNTTAFACLVAVIIFLSAVMTVKPLERGAEDETMKYMAEWFWHSPYAGRPLHTTHVLFTYYSLDGGFGKGQTIEFDSLSVVNMKKGDLFLYDNHYSYRNVSTALLDSSRISLVKEFNLPGSPFVAYLLEKR